MYAWALMLMLSQKTYGSVSCDCATFAPMLVLLMSWKASDFTCFKYAMYAQVSMLMMSQKSQAPGGAVWWVKPWSPLAALLCLTCFRSAASAVLRILSKLLQLVEL